MLEDDRSKRCHQDDILPANATSQLQKRRRILLEAINSWLPIDCCRNSCAQKIGVENCRSLRQTFLQESRDTRKSLLRNFASETVGDRNVFVLNGVTVCWSFVIRNLEASRSLISNVLQLPSANASHLPGRIRGTDGSLTKKSVVAFLQILADEVGDELPNRRERHLPHGNKNVVYLLYHENERKYSQNPCNSSHFYQVWKKYVPHIKCRRNHGFTVCDTCTHFKERLQRLARVEVHKTERTALKKGFDTHLKHICAERTEYRMVQNMAREKPKEVLSVIIDGADQAKFGLPRFPTQTKRETGDAVKQKVTGVLFHSGLLRQDFLSFFTSADNLPSGANQTINTFCRALFVLKEKREAHGLTTIPSVLCIQLNNTTKDNKNRFSMAFCDYLVHVGLFRRITVNFLPVGHTHEDIDRIFSRVSVHLKHRTTATVKDLHEAIKFSQLGKVEPFVSRINGMNNFSSALVQQKLVVSQVSGFLTYRKFVFERDLSRDGDGPNVYVTCMAGHNMCDKCPGWKTLERRPGFYGVFLKSPPDMKNPPPMQTKSFSQKEIDGFRKRLRLTDARLANTGKTHELRSEIDRIGSQTVAEPEWKFGRIRELALKSLRRETEELESEDEVLEDGSTYEIGDMVTVNCGAKTSSATPFWLARIEHVSMSESRETMLDVWWYEVYGTCAHKDACYRSPYRPMRNSPDCRDEVSDSSVLVSFGALSDNNTIPESVQRLTREALDPFLDVLSDSEE